MYACVRLCQSMIGATGAVDTDRNECSDLHQGCLLLKKIEFIRQRLTVARGGRRGGGGRGSDLHQG